MSVAPLRRRSASPDGLWAPDRRALTVGLVLTVTLVAFEALAVITILPAIKDDLSGIRLYGWVTSAFVLSTLIGIVVAGEQADRVGPARPFAIGLAFFSVGLVLGGLAPTMLVLVLARALQGLGAGVIPAVAYVAIGRTYPDALRPRMFAVLSTAWVVPGLIGPSISALVATHFHWRMVFFGLIPLVLFAGALTLPALRPLAPEAVDGDAEGEDGDGKRSRSRLPLAIRVSVGSGLVLSGLSARSLAGVPLVAAGLLVGVPALVRLVPPGTFRARPGLPAAVLARGLLTFAFFGADTYVPLGFTDVLDRSPAVASIAITAATLAWTAGAWVQSHFATRWTSRRLVRSGFGLIATGIGLVALGMSAGAVPLAVPIVGWGVAGLGMGLAYAPISMTVLRAAAPGQEGAATSAMQLCDNLGFALGAGLGGVAVAVGDASSWHPRSGILIAFALAGAVAVAGQLESRRLP